VALEPLAEEPGGEDESASRRRTGLNATLHRWARLLSGAGGADDARPSADLRVLLSVLACPLSPVPILPRIPRNVASSAQYIIEQFRATTRCGKLEGKAKSMYAAGKVRLAMLHEPAGGGAAAVPAGGRCHEGSFVVWQLAPGMWIVEMAVAGHSVAAGSDGRVAWRRTPWLGAHAARGGSRPLRRALQVGITSPPQPRTIFLHSRARRRCHFCMSTVMPYSTPPNLFPFLSSLLITITGHGGMAPHASHATLFLQAAL
jgi:hypothetical protein